MVDLKAVSMVDLLANTMADLLGWWVGYLVDQLDLWAVTKADP